MTSTFLSENLVGIILFILRIGITLTLFAFFWIVVKSIWHDIKEQTLSSNVKSIATITFTEEGQESQSFALNKIFLGRDPGCDLVIEDKLVSGKHAHCYFQKNQWWLEDNNSSNGTFINGRPVETPTVVTSGDELLIGECKLKINVSS